jgi:hypothetical protein
MKGHTKLRTSSTVTVNKAMAGPFPEASFLDKHGEYCELNTESDKHHEFPSLMLCK